MSKVGLCPFCRKDIDIVDNLLNCPRCKTSLDGVDLVSKARVVIAEEIAGINTYLLPSAISILFCGLFGIFATVYSILTISAKKDHRLVKAEQYSKSAKGWMIAAYITGIVGAFLGWLGRGGQF